MPRFFLAVAFFLACLSPMTTNAQPTGARPARADADAAISYTLRFPDAARHYVDVEATYPTAGQPRIELMMAVWTPGSYLVREYARHVEAVEVTDPSGAKAPVKVRKNRWAIETGGAPRVTVRYRVYGREMSVRTNWVEARYALLNGAATFLTLVGGQARPHHVSLVLPQGWTRAMSGLPEAGGRFTAADFDTLVDSPIVAGALKVYEFTQSGKPHFLVNVNEGGNWDGARAIGDVQKIVAEHEKMWGSLPYDKYVFINMITEAGGGLEHKNSTVLMTSRWAMGTRQSYLGWLDLVSHEFFHVWNVKRLRPAALGPFDYETENYSPSLWVSEGFTSYYGDLLVRRAGLSSDQEYASGLSNQLRALETTAGRLVQPVTQSSYDAWIKQYRPDENSGNTSIDYYTKGAAIAFMLDARIRKATNGAKTLDTAMRLAYDRYSGAKGYTPEQFQQTMAEAAGVDLTAWFADAVSSTKELDFTEALGYYGLRFTPVDLANARPTMGASTRNDNGRLVVSVVRRGTPAHAAGVNVDDELLAIDDLRVRADGLVARMDQYKVGDKVRLLVARRDRLVTLEVTLAAEPGRPWRLQPAPDQTAEQKAHLEAWLGR